MKIIFFSSFLLFASAVFASEQFPDLIIFNGQQFKMHNFPLKTYFDIHPNRRPRNAGTVSALWRGYRATFEIINNELILIDIEVMRLFRDDFRSVFRRRFRNRMKVDTFTGNLNLIDGEMTWLFIGFTPIYENYVVLEIVNGNLIAVHTMTAYEYLQSRIRSLPGGSDMQNRFIELLDVLLEKQNSRIR